MTRLNLRTLKLIGFVLPSLGLVVLEVVRATVFAPRLDPLVHRVLAVAIMVMGVFLFTHLIFRLLERLQRRILEQNRQLEHLHQRAQRRSEQLAALAEAIVSLTAEVSVQAVLHKLADFGRRMGQARYGVVALTHDDGPPLARLVTSGLSDEVQERLQGAPPGHGLLTLPLERLAPVRLGAVPPEQQVPALHPLQSFLGVPIISKGRVLGALYLMDKEADGGFTQEDEDIITLFANHAAVAVENARLYQRLRALAVLEDRERISKELHDGIIQQIYAVGLALEGIHESLEEDPAWSRERVDYVIGKLNETIKDIRNYIFDLRPQEFHGKSLLAGLQDLVAELRLNALLDVELDVAPDAEESLDKAQVVQLLQIAREALTNIVKHARARSASITVLRHDDGLHLTIRDDGVGFDPHRPRTPERQGLRNMAERAREMGGRFQIISAPGNGTELRLVLPARVPA